MKQVKGGLEGKGLKIALIVARFNEYFTEKLVEGAHDTLVRSGVRASDITTVRVPGSLEIPLVVKRLLARKRFDALITLGLILKGETRHWAQVSDGASRGVVEASLKYDVPVIHGVVTAENLAQAIDRIGGKMGHKGRECALSAIEMARLLKKL